MPFDPNQMDVIDRRKVEAMVLGPMLRAFQKRFGEVETNEVAAHVITEIARKQGKDFADGIGSNSLVDYASNKDAWRRNGALEFEVLEESETKYSFNVTRCKYAEMYRELGFGDLGEIFSCTRDFEFCGGFNSDVELTRTQTIMEGASHCDFRYVLKKKSDS